MRSRVLKTGMAILLVVAVCSASSSRMQPKPLYIRLDTSVRYEKRVNKTFRMLSKKEITAYLFSVNCRCSLPGNRLVFYRNDDTVRGRSFEPVKVVSSDEYTYTDVHTLTGIFRLLDNEINDNYKIYLVEPAAGADSVFQVNLTGSFLGR